MKQININKMSNNTSEKINILGNVMGVCGNNNIRSQHIAYLEKQIYENNEFHKKDLSVCPNFYSWLVIKSEHIFWLIREFCYHHNNLHSPTDFNLEYNKLLRVFSHKCKDMKQYSEDEVKEMFQKIVSVLIIRHSHIHGGFPNTFPATLKHLENIQRPTFNKEDTNNFYTIEEVKERIIFCSNPTNFLLICEEFNEIQSFINRAKPYSIGF